MRLYTNLRKGKPVQKRQAEKLCSDTGVDIEKMGGGIEALRLFQQFLSNYKIIVYTDMAAKNILFEDSANSSEKYIELFYYKNHYNLINSITGFIGKPYYCRLCRVGYFVKTAHKCPHVCKRCLKSPPCLSNDNYSERCAKCHLFFHSQQCLMNHYLPHFANQKSVCDTIKFCALCRKMYSLEKIKQHKYGYTKCNICHAYLPSGHHCYVQPPRKKKDDKKLKLFIFYDFECR